MLHSIVYPSGSALPPPPNDDSHASSFVNCIAKVTSFWSQPTTIFNQSKSLEKTFHPSNNDSPIQHCGNETGPSACLEIISETAAIVKQSASPLHTRNDDDNTTARITYLATQVDEREIREAIAQYIDAIPNPSDRLTLEQLNSITKSTKGKNRLKAVTTHWNKLVNSPLNWSKNRIYKTAMSPNGAIKLNATIRHLDKLTYP